MENTFYKVLVIEDDPNLGPFVKTSLEARSHIVTLLTHGKQALQHLKNTQMDSYDVVLLDLNLPGASGWEILTTIRAQQNTKDYTVLMFTAVDDDNSEARSLYDGADDFIPKPCSLKVLLARIEANVRKKKSKSVLNIDLPFDNVQEMEELTTREKEILAYLVKGYSNKEIAEIAIISDQTVMNHVRNIYQKLKVETRVQAAIMAIKYNLF